MTMQVDDMGDTWTKTLLARSTIPPELEQSHAPWLHASEIMSIDPACLVLRVCDRVRASADEKDVDLVVRCFVARVTVRHEPFAEALYNLVKNAVEASSAGYPVVVVVSPTPDGNVLWEVQDNGEGMSPATLAWLGEPFRSTRRRAIGLGVALAQRVIDDHGGVLSFESAPGIGTTASAWVPAIWQWP